MGTPPPFQIIPIPILKINIGHVILYLKENWFLEPFWTISYSESKNNPIDFKGFILKINRKWGWLIEDMPKKYLFDDFKTGATKFTGCVNNNYLVYGVIQIIINSLFNKNSSHKLVSDLPDKTIRNENVEKMFEDIKKGKSFH